MGGSISEIRGMFKNIKSTDIHFATSGRMVFPEHFFKGFPKNIQVVIGKSRLCGKMSGNESMCTIQTVRNGKFATHRSVVTFLFFGFGFCRHSHTSNAMLGRNNRINGTRKSHLNRSANLAGIFSSTHHSTKSSNIEILSTHKFASCFRLIGIFLFRFYGFAVVCFVNGIIQNSLFFNENVVTLFALFRKLNEITNFAFQADIRNQAIARFGVKTRQITCVWIAIGITILHIKEKDKIVTLCDNVFLCHN